MLQLLAAWREWGRCRCCRRRALSGPQGDATTIAAQRPFGPGPAFSISAVQVCDSTCGVHGRFVWGPDLYAHDACAVPAAPTRLAFDQGWSRDMCKVLVSVTAA